MLQSFNGLKMDISNILFSLKIKHNKNKKSLNLRQNFLQLDIIKSKQLNTIYAEYALKFHSLNSNNINKTDKDKSNTMILDTGIERINDKKILEYKDFELNEFNYEDALKNDKRKFFYYYL